MGMNISKNDLYESVKALVEVEDKHIHLNQHKLFTLFSIAFQYLLYRSTKKPGAYIIRIEDSMLMDKLTKKAKDPSSRKFLQALALPRKFKYNKSVFYLDFFHIATWKMTNEIPQEKIQAALIVKNSSSRPMDSKQDDDSDEEKDELLSVLPENYFLTSLQEFVPKTITIAYEQEFTDVTPVEFPFIKKDQEKALSGVKISKDIEDSILS